MYPQQRKGDLCRVSVREGGWEDLAVVSEPEACTLHTLSLCPVLSRRLSSRDQRPSGFLSETGSHDSGRGPP